MKKAILLSAVLAVGAAFAAEVQSENAIGALDKTISSSDPDQVLIAVPFVGYEGEGAVKVKDMVKTSTLAEGSKLYVPTTSGYNTWTLNGNGEWVADRTVNIAGGKVVEGESTSQDDATVKRGDAFWLEPKFKTGANSGTIFLLGQETGAAGKSTIAPGLNLIGNASIKTVNLVKIKASDGDQIIVQQSGGQLTYHYKTGTGWRYVVSVSAGWSQPVTTIQIDPGQGCWYNRKGSQVEFDWSAD